jgi:exosortase
MSAVSAHTSIPSTSKAAPPGVILLYITALGAAWLLVAWRLSYVWDSSDQYSHGWLVPLLAGWVFWNRWSTRPVPASPAGWTRIAAWLALGLVLLPAAAANLVLESSPDWRMMMYVLVGAVFLASLALTELAGGAPWRRHLAVAFVFALLAVPWPYDFETWLTVELSMLAARITTAVLNFVGILAVCEGNMIEVTAGVLGVEDACSGVRSFQSSFVVAMLLGEWFMLRLGWRVFLCLLALSVAYALNIARMLMLCLAVENSGMDAVARWHDPAGFLILFVTLGFLWLAGFALVRIPGTTSPELPLAASTTRGLISRCVALASILVLVGLGGIIVATEGWYRSKERDHAPVLAWTIVAAGPEAGDGDVPLGDNVARFLGYDTGFRRVWKEANGCSWEIIYMRWEPGRKAASAGPHAPDYCQKASGRTVVGKSELRSAKVGGIVLPYQIYTVADAGRPFHLLFTIDDGRRDAKWMEAGLMGDGSSRERRLNQVREGRRNTGQTSLQLALVGVEDAAVAEQKMLEILPTLIQPVR